MESQSGMSASVAALPINRDEHRAIEILAELYSGFINEKAVAKDLAGLSTPVERLEEILRYRLHPALYTNLVWRGTGYESQQALTPRQLEEKLAAATEYSKMNLVTKFACDKLWTFGVQATWQTIRDEIERIRTRSS